MPKEVRLAKRFCRLAFCKAGNTQTYIDAYNVKHDFEFLTDFYFDAETFSAILLDVFGEEVYDADKNIFYLARRQFYTKVRRARFADKNRDKLRLKILFELKGGELSCSLKSTTKKY